ncbi:MAG: DUF4112 domain-containing protein [Pseudomonadota bacterium]
MPSTSSPAAPPPDRAARIAWLERLADKLDSRFSLFGIRFGWDSLLGLIPGVGDAATALPGAYMIYEGARLGVRRPVLARMALNTGIDFVVGGMPVVGDIFDLAFKANRRNIALLKQDLARQGIAPLSAAQVDPASGEAGRI